VRRRTVPEELVVWEGVGVGFVPSLAAVRVTIVAEVEVDDDEVEVAGG
jgi:hypothetical protein